MTYWPRVCPECGDKHRRDNPYPRLIEYSFHTEVICTSLTDPLAKELNHYTYAAGRQYGTVHIRIPEWIARGILKLQLLGYAIRRKVASL